MVTLDPMLYPLYSVVTLEKQVPQMSITLHLM